MHRYSIVGWCGLGARTAYAAQRNQKYGGGVGSDARQCERRGLNNWSHRAN